MKDLIFLPIDINIVQYEFVINKQDKATHDGLWNTKHLGGDDIISSGMNSITDQLPYKTITLVKYNTQPSTIPPHIDVSPTWTKTLEEYAHIKNNEPAGYRVVLIGKHDSLEVFNGKEWITAYLPHVPCCYLINSTTALHRVKEDVDRKTIYLRGFLDPIKHAELIERSWNKYKNYAIKSVSVL